MRAAVLLSGGVGLRMGADMPKQYIRVSGRMLVTYCLETLLNHPMIEGVQVVAEEEWREAILEDARESGLSVEKIIGFSKPGAERQSSIFHALTDLRERMGGVFCGAAGGAAKSEGPDDGSALIRDAVLIHDAVRPNVTEEQVTACFQALHKHDGAMPVLPMKDTVYLSGDGKRVSELLDRERVFAGQAPEAFVFDKYYAANLRLVPEGMGRIRGSTEPAVLAGMDVAMIPGDENNYKITTKADLRYFRKQKERLF